MGYVQSTPPTTTVLATSDVKSHLRVDFDDDDVYLNGLIHTAERYAERYTGRQFMSATWTLTLDHFPYCGTGPFDNEIILRYPPLASVDSITYVNSSSGTTSTWSSSEYQVETNEHKGRVSPAYNYVWPTPRAEPGAVTVTFTAGATSSTNVPIEARHAMKMLVGHWYCNRLDVVNTGVTPQMQLRAANDLLNMISIGEYE